MPTSKKRTPKRKATPAALKSSPTPTPTKTTKPTSKPTKPTKTSKVGRQPTITDAQASKIDQLAATASYQHPDGSPNVAGIAKEMGGDITPSKVRSRLRSTGAIPKKSKKRTNTSNTSTSNTPTSPSNGVDLSAVTSILDELAPPTDDGTEARVYLYAAIRERMGRLATQRRHHERQIQTIDLAMAWAEHRITQIDKAQPDPGETPHPTWVRLRLGLPST